ncbi:MAG: phosphohistidine phosphatase [Candidatus Marinimicrobia bacterium]|nr:phosphohistidine phosphatase [Candidatus Neomarinimicrobiota bacterium]
MSKSVIIFRHGKSDWDAAFDCDHNRPVSKRGKKDAKKMGKYLNRIEQDPDLTISSTALRARDTAKLAMEYGKWNNNIIYERKIYGGSAEVILQVISQQNSKYNNICVVGHEPILSSFIAKCNNSPPLKFPTASMARIDFEINNWNHINFKFGNLVWLLKPKEID